MAEPRVEVGERIARLETKLEGVERALDRGSEGFEKIRTSLDGLTKLVGETHAACVKPSDLHARDVRIDKLETFRDRVKRYGTAGSVIGGGIVGAITMFGPTKIAEAWQRLWS